MMIASTKADLYFSDLDSAQRHYCGETSAFSKVIRSRLLDHVGGNNFRYGFAPVVSWEEDLIWNSGNGADGIAKTHLAGSANMRGMWVHFNQELSELADVN